MFTACQSAGWRPRFNGKYGKPSLAEPIDSGAGHFQKHNLKTLKRSRESLSKKIEPFNIVYVNFHCGRRHRLLECLTVEGVVPLYGSVTNRLLVEEDFSLLPAATGRSRSDAGLGLIDCLAL